MTAFTLKQVSNKLAYIDNQWQKYQKTMAQLDPILTHLTKELDLLPAQLMTELFKTEVNLDNKQFFNSLKTLRLQKFKDLLGENYPET
jgi:hypothetical protein